MRKILYRGYEFGFSNILLDLDCKSFGQRFIINFIRQFTDPGLGNTWTMNLDYNYYILRALDFNIPRLRIWISIVIYLTGLGLENTRTTNLDYDY